MRFPSREGTKGSPLPLSLSLFLHPSAAVPKVSRALPSSSSSLKNPLHASSSSSSSSSFRFVRMDQVGQGEVREGEVWLIKKTSWPPPPKGDVRPLPPYLPTNPHPSRRSQLTVCAHKVYPTSIFQKKTYFRTIFLFLSAIPSCSK